MVQNILVIINGVKNKVTENLSGKTVQLIKEILIIIILRVKEFMYGKIKDSMMGIGLIIKWRVLVLLHGL